MKKRKTCKSCLYWENEVLYGKYKSCINLMGSNIDPCSMYKRIRNPKNVVKNISIEKEIKMQIKKIEMCKKRVAKERDKLRTYLSDLESIAESFDRGVEGMESGIWEIESGIDSLSEFI